MSASLFGGSFNLVETDDQTLKSLFTSHMKWVAFNYSFPWAEQIPFLPKDRIQDTKKFLDDVIAKRRTEMRSGIAKKDIFQILIDNHDANPGEFSLLHLRASMFIFMYDTHSKISIPRTDMAQTCW